MVATVEELEPFGDAEGVDWETAPMDLLEAQLTLLSVGRETRVVPRRIRRALNRRDQNRCQFLGCGATRRLHAHHIVHWANGGPTELPNLVLVCNFHHHLLHEHGWNIEANPAGGYTWITPSGETATIKVFRGRHTDLPHHTDPDGNRLAVGQRLG